MAVRRPAALQTEPAHTTLRGGGPADRGALAALPVDGDAGQRNPVVIMPARNPHNLTVRQHIDTSRLGMVVHVEDQPALRPAVTRQSNHRLAPVPAPDEAAHKAQCARLVDLGRAVAVSVASPAVVERQSLSGPRGEHDAAETDPVVVAAASMPGDLSVRLHVHTGRLGMVVHVEDQALLRSAVAWQLHHRVAPVASAHQTLDLAHHTCLRVCGLGVRAAIAPPAMLHREDTLAACGKLDAVQVEPAVMPCARHIVHLSVPQHIHTQCVLVVVEVEDHTLVRAAVCRQCGKRVLHAAPLDQAAHHAEVTVLGGARSLVSVAVRRPAALQTEHAHPINLACD